MIQTATKFIKNISFNMIADLSIKLSKSLLIIFISNLLGISLMGAFSIALTFLGFGILFSNWGFGNLLTREVSRDQDKINTYLSNYAILRIAFALITVILINVLLPLFSYSKITGDVIRIISISLVATSIIKLYYSLFIAFEALKYISIISLIGSLLRLGISILTMLTGGGLVAVAIVYTVTEYVILAFSTILTIRFLPAFRFEFNLNFALNQIAIALPFFWIGMLVMLDTRTEILILSWFYEERIVGYYTAVNTILGGLTLFSEGVRNSIFPLVTKLQQSAPEKLKQIVQLLGKYLLALTIPIAILCFFQAENLIFLLFKDQSPLTIQMLKITIWVFASYTLTVVISTLLLAYNLEKKVATALLISGVTTVILNLALINLVGPEGVAIVRLLSSVMMLVICLVFLVKHAGYGILDLKTSFLVLFSGGLMFATLAFLPVGSSLAASIIALVLYLASLALTGIIQMRDLSLWKKILQNFTQ